MEGSFYRSFSMSSSFANALELPLRYVDKQHGNGSSSTLGSNRNDIPPPNSSSTHQPSQWTASDRAERVDRDPKLQSLLAAEIKESGVVTAAGYKAVHQKFMYSEVMELEMKRANERRPIRPVLRTRSGRFSSLLSCSIGNAASQTQLGVSSRQLMASRSESYNTTTSNDDDSKNRNIAPLKTSRVCGLTQKQREELLEGDDAFTNCLQRQDSNKSLNLQDIFDGTEGTHLFKSPSPAAEPLPMPKKSHASLDVLTATSSTFLRLDTLPVDSDEVNFYSDTSSIIRNDSGKSNEGDEKDGLKSSVQSSEHSYVDDCGWLPWPEQKDYDNIDNTGEELLEPFQLSYQAEDSFLPRPFVRKSDRVLAWPEQKDDDSIGNTGEDLLEPFQPSYQGEDSFSPYPDPKNSRARAA